MNNQWLKCYSRAFNRHSFISCNNFLLINLQNFSLRSVCTDWVMNEYLNNPHKPTFSFSSWYHQFIAAWMFSLHVSISSHVSIFYFRVALWEISYAIDILWICVTKYFPSHITTALIFCWRFLWFIWENKNSVGIKQYLSHLF